MALAEPLGAPPELEELSPVEHLKSLLLRGNDVKRLPAPEPLIEGLLDLDALAVLYGRTGSGKSFVAIDLALSVGMGWDWLGRRVERGTVLYVAAEGVAGLGARVAAWERHHGVIAADADVWWLPAAVNLYRPRRDTAHLFAELAAGLRPKLVIVDTLARCTIGADENSARDMGIIVEDLDRVRQVTGACVLAVHHTGKNTEQGLRGSSALLAAVDTSLRLDGAEGYVTLTVEKQKHHGADEKLRLRLVPADDSCALAAHRGEDPGLTNAARIALETLRDIEVPGGISASAWQEATEVQGASRRSFFNARRRLLDAGLVQNVGTDRAPRYLTCRNGEQ